MAPSTTSAPPVPQPPAPARNRVPRAVHIIRRAYSAADAATDCCAYHGVRLMAKTLWLVRQLPLEKYGQWKRGAGELSFAEKVEGVMFTRLWRFIQLEVDGRIEVEAGPLWRAYEEVLFELDRCAWIYWREGQERKGTEKEEE